LSVSTSSIPIEWDNLSERGQAILRLIAQPLSLGFGPREIGRGLGISGPSVLRLVDELRTELERLALPR
jgi:DNA-binding CsgD family transcriptional regulator